MPALLPRRLSAALLLGMAVMLGSVQMSETFFLPVLAATACIGPGAVGSSRRSADLLSQITARDQSAPASPSPQRDKEGNGLDRRSLLAAAIAGAMLPAHLQNKIRRTDVVAQGNTAAASDIERHSLGVTDLEKEVSFWTRVMGMSVTPTSDAAGRELLCVSYGASPGGRRVQLDLAERGGMAPRNFPRMSVDLRLQFRPSLMADVVKLGGKVVSAAGGTDGTAGNEVQVLSPSGHLARIQLVRSSVPLLPTLVRVARVA